MTTEFPYKLKPYKTGSDRETCPSCGAKRQFARYIEVDTGDLLPERYGWCNRRDSCGYHLNPLTDGYKTERETSGIPVIARLVKPNIVVDLPSDLLINSLDWSEGNSLYKYLLSILPDEKVISLFEEYLVGNHSVWPGAVIFWYVNKSGAIRAGQVKQFDEKGHTVKVENEEHEIKPRTIWIHNLIPEERYDWMPAYKDQNLRQDCLFGEHLMDKYPGNPVAMFESPKTAIMAAAYFPDFLCMAFGSLDNFTFERSKILKGRKVILYPDLSKTGSAFNKWAEKAERFKSITQFKVSTILEDNATDDQRLKGLDMADFLELFDYAEISAKPLINQRVEQKTRSNKIEAAIHQPVTKILVTECAVTRKIVLTQNQIVKSVIQCNVTPTAENSAVKPDQKADNPAVQIEDSEDLINEPEIQAVKPSLFDSSEYREWLKTVELPIGHIMLNGQVTIHHLPNCVTGMLNHVDAFADYKLPGNRNLFIRRLKYIRRHLHTLTNHINAAKTI